MRCGWPATVGRWLARCAALLLVTTAALAADPPEVAAARARLVQKGGPALAAAWVPGAPLVLIVEFADAGGTSRREASPARAGRLAALKARVLAGLPRDDAETLRDYSHLPMAFLRVRTAGAIARLLALPDVVAVYPDTRLRTNLAESLPQIRQPPAAGLGARGAGRTVVVADTGVDFTRAEFGNCTAPGLPADTCRVPAALDLATDDGARDDNGHGTHTAAVALGVAPGARVAALDVFDGSSATASTIVAALNWAIANQASLQIAAVNLSLGDGQRYTSTCRMFNPYRTPIQTLRNAGVLTVAAAGNDGYTDGISSPACTPEAVSVGAVYDGAFGSLAWSGCTDATTALDQVTCFSNSASFLTLLAPGALITAAGLVYGGTSEATPHVAGAAAVLRAAYPAETAAALQTRLQQGVSVTDVRNSIVKPRLDLLRALGAVNDAFAAGPVITGAAANYSVETASATAQAGEPAHAGVPATRSVWWSWTAPADGLLTLDTAGSSFDTVLAVYTGTAVGALVPVAANNDSGAAGGASALTVAVTAGTTYRIVVDAATGTGGTARLTLGFAPAPPPPDNDADVPLPPAAWALLAALLAGGGAARLRRR